MQKAIITNAIGTFTKNANYQLKSLANTPEAQPLRLPLFPTQICAIIRSCILVKILRNIDIKWKV